MVFRVRLFLSVQGARSRGPGQNNTNWPGARKGVLEDTFSPPLPEDIWVFPRLFPPRDSRYNTHLFRGLSRLGLEGRAKGGRFRAVAPKGLAERDGKSRIMPLPGKRGKGAGKEGTGSFTGSWSLITARKYSNLYNNRGRKALKSLGVG